MKHTDSSIIGLSISLALIGVSIFLLSFSIMDNTTRIEKIEGKIIYLEEKVKWEQQH